MQGRVAAALQEQLAVAVDASALDGVVGAARGLYEAREKAACVANLLRCTRLTQAMDALCFHSSQEVELFEVDEDTRLTNVVEAKVYLASWSRSREQAFHGGISRRPDLISSTERDFVTCFAGEVLLAWDWMGPLQWLQQEGVQLRSNNAVTRSEVVRRLQASKKCMQEAAMAYYKAKLNGRIEVIDVRFVQRVPSAASARVPFLRDIIEGANVHMKFRISRSSVNRSVGGLLAPFLSMHSLAVRALNPNLKASVVLAFGPRFKDIAMKIATFIPEPGEVANSLRSLAQQQVLRAKRDHEEIERIYSEGDVPLSKRSRKTHGVSSDNS